MKNPFKKKNNKSFNIHHPDIIEQIEPAFKAGGRQYYRFKEEYRMPAGRYKYVYAAIREVDLRMDLNTLKQIFSELKKCLDGSKKTIDLEKAWRLILNGESRTSLAFEPEGVKRLAAVTYFDEPEDLSTYDHKHGLSKIDFWDRHNCVDFFLTRPIGELLQLSGISLTSLEEYIQETTLLIQDLNSGLQSLSAENSSESGKKTS